uniref:C-type lectin domain-containing protein n=1 Tax=Labrus bergylta TaxID=56723 RepID=A0A3Q3FGX0_9LABR
DKTLTSQGFKKTTTSIIMFNSQLFSLAYSPGFCTPILYALREFHYIDLKMNWADAQQYCREKYTDLATIESMADNNRLKGIEPSQAWIGLHDDPLNSWRWSSTGEFTERDNHNWRQSEPNSLYGQHCVVMNSDKSLDDEDCNREFYFVCYNGKIHLATEKQTQQPPVLEKLSRCRSGKSCT